MESLNDRSGTISSSVYEDESHLEENELSRFILAVKQHFGPEQAPSAAEDWLTEADLIDAPPFSTQRDWQSVTIAASARLSSCIDALHRRILISLAFPPDPTQPPTPPSDRRM